MEHRASNEKFHNSRLEKNEFTKKQENNCGLLTTAINVRFSEPRGKNRYNCSNADARSNCRKQRVAIKCGRSEISRGIDYWSSFELKCGAPQTKKKANKKNSLCIRNSENTAKI